MTDEHFPCDSEIPNAATVAAIQEARQGELPTFDNLADLMADLNFED